MSKLLFAVKPKFTALPTLSKPDGSGYRPMNKALQAYERTAGLPEPIITEPCFSKTF
ncbi:hypothetical protein [Pedobacter sp. BS3]|uniref:hypothetical protein n=1 Tax=Pedobacter sp. BS3 TaxID=2567937 RepID=UPI0016592639|nr:hypothetical protein [Pedobacter sp. BS3]